MSSEMKLNFQADNRDIVKNELNLSSKLDIGDIIQDSEGRRHKVILKRFDENSSGGGFFIFNLAEKGEDMGEKIERFSFEAINKMEENKEIVFIDFIEKEE